MKNKLVITVLFLLYFEATHALVSFGYDTYNWNYENYYWNNEWGYYNNWNNSWNWSNTYNNYLNLNNNDWNISWNNYWSWNNSNNFGINDYKTYPSQNLNYYQDNLFNDYLNYSTTQITNTWYFPEYNYNTSNNSFNNYINYSSNNYLDNSFGFYYSLISSQPSNNIQYNPTLSINKNQFYLTDNWELNLAGAPPNQPVYICAIDNKGIESCTLAANLGLPSYTTQQGTWQARGSWLNNNIPTESILGNWTEWIYVGGIKSNEINFTVNISRLCSEKDCNLIPPPRIPGRGY